MYPWGTTVRPGLPRRRRHAQREGRAGKRFTSVEVVRVCDGNVVHLGHHARADGRWRVYAFADMPSSGEPSALAEREKVYAAGPSEWNSVDIFAERGLSRDGVVVVTRPDQYVAAVLPLSSTDELAAFFAQSLP